LENFRSKFITSKKVSGQFAIFLETHWGQFEFLKNVRTKIQHLKNYKNEEI